MLICNLIEMKKIFLITIFSVFLFVNSYGQSAFWKQVPKERVSKVHKMERVSTPEQYKLFRLNLSALKEQLLEAPLDTNGSMSNVIVDFPNPDGKLDHYRIYEAPIMEEALANKYPDIKSYMGKGIDDPTATIRFSLTLFGLHTMTTSGDKGTSFIDTYTKDLKDYIVYNKSDVQTTRNFKCLVENTAEVPLEGLRMATETGQRASGGQFSVYRLAMACTVEYAAYHVNAAGLSSGTLAQKKAAVLAAMNVTMTRVNGIFERDMSLRMNLVANNNAIIFIDSDSFTNNDAYKLIDESQTVIDAAIGSANYDIGHTFSTGGGGLAAMGSPCSSGKARGITGSGAPVGDGYDIDYVAHEMGHQFGANHTQNNSCNRNDATAVEPGSGSTIMGYAGICAPDVQNNSDAHFHAVSIAEMSAFVSGSGSCAVTTSNGNSAPIVNAGLDYTIPKGTAFILKGSATDTTIGSALTYCWEQTDTEASTQPPVQGATNGPNFRSNLPTSSPDRYMPSLSSVIANNLAPTWEVVPTVARSMNFALTVRDNVTTNGGQTGRDNVVITTASVGPFLVNSPNTAVSWIPGSNQTVTWSVAGTTANNINATYVDILLSKDGGNTYPVLLASKVPNDGSEVITVPNSPGATNRIMVRGYNHIFYDISNVNFTIAAATSTFSVAFSGTAEEQNKSTCQGSDATFSFPYTTLSGFNGTTTFSATGLPGGAIATFSPVSTSAAGNVALTISNTNSSVPGFYNIIVSATSGATTKTVSFYLEILNSSFPNMVLVTPSNNAISPSTSLSLTWEANSSAVSYDIQVATDNAFTNIVASANVTTLNYSVSGLSISTDYFWRVLPKNGECGGSYSNPYKFTIDQILCNTTSATDIPKIISGSGTPTITSTLNIPTGRIISDVNITMNVTHTWINDLTATLISPSGTEVQLFARPCTDGIPNINATFDDAGIVVVCGTNPGISGTVQSKSALSAFNGLSATGIWTLRISDAFNGDGGTLNSWSLNICATNTYTVAFNNNNGSGTMTSQVAAAATALTTNTFTNAGYHFTGWNTETDGSGTAYADGASYSFTADVTLYAQWRAYPTASVLSGTATICSGTATNLSVAITGGTAPYTVVYNNGVSDVSVSNYVSGTAISVMPSSSTTYTLVSVTDANTSVGTGNSGSAVITVNTTPAPTADAQTFCGSKTVADLVATGTDIKWYAAETGGTALTSDTALVTGTTYYASQTLNGCESTRTGVAVTITPQPANPNAVNIDVTYSGNCAILSGTYINSGLLNGYFDFQLMGSFHISYDGTKWVLWGYDDISNTGFMSSSDASNGLYPPTTGWVPTDCGDGDLTWSYATTPLACYQTASFNSTSCTWDITGTAPAMPTASAQTFCGSKTVADLVATGTDLQWYAAETGGAALASITAITTGNYYVSQALNNCESDRTAVVVTVNNSVAGTVSADQLVFIGTPPANITLTGSEGTVQWQSSLDNSTFADIAEATGTTLTGIQMGALTTKRYYRAVVTNGSCASATSGVVTVTVIPATKVQASQCGKTLASLNTAIVANSVTGATHYRFKVVTHATSETIETISRWFYLKSLTGGALYNKTYTISVATKHNGVWGAYGEECAISTPIFIPATKVQDSQCGKTLADLNTAIIANTVSGATNYRFKVVNGATTRYAETVSRWFYLKSLTGGGSFSTTYTISVANKYNGVWSDYGDACMVTTPGPITKVQASQCGQTLAALSTAIVANSITGATNYRFKIVNGATTRYAETVSRWFYLKSLTGGGLYSTAYTISVAVKYNGVWGAYGDECTVTTPSAPITRPVDLETETDLAAIKVTGSPNPYTNRFKIDINTQSNARVEVMVYDMIGKLIEVRNSGVAELGTMEIGDNYATGIYNVMVTQGTETKTLRMIKK